MRLELPAQLIINHVATLQAQWLEQLAQPDARQQLWELGGEVERVDATGLALLLALLRSLRESDCGWAWPQGVPPTLDQAAGDLGVACELHAGAVEPCPQATA